MAEGIPERWKLLSGEDNWHNLLDPLDKDLRKYIIHYGERAQATYDTFNFNPLSKYAGSSRFGKDHLFSKVGLEKGNPYKYKVVKFLYATSKLPVPDSFIMKSSADQPWSKESNWIGYVAVATDEGKTALGRRDILIAWRGTIRALEWVKDYDAIMVPASKILGKAGDLAHVHSGFLSIYTSSNEDSPYNKKSARDQVMSEVKRQLEIFKDEETSITITGHSMGSALATLNAADIVTNAQQDKPALVTAFLFASPRVGDVIFKEVIQSMENLHILNILNVPDVIPLVPTLPYVHVGTILAIDSRDSPFLKQPGNPVQWHSLEGSYLHTIAGPKETNNNEFKFEVKRDISLVNKMSSALKERYSVPAFWWVTRNKGMVQTDDGSWQLDYHRDKVEDEIE